MGTRKIKFIGMTIWLCLIISESLAYDTDRIHPLINVSAINRSVNFLSVLPQLGLDQGIDTIVNKKQIYKWFEDGGKKEDDGVRWLHHFHDPTRTWDIAGLGGAVDRYSSLLWAQNNQAHNTLMTNEWSWVAARTYYYQALTEQTKTLREENLANSLRSLGQVMHLLADAAVPEHVRDEMHPFGSRYEIWSKGNAAEFANNSGPAINYSITNTTIVPDIIPISNFWDTTSAEGYGGTLLGLAEYTNYNFLSPHTIFKNYTYPVNPQYINKKLEVVSGEDKKTGDKRVYFGGMTSDGKPIKHLVSTGYLWSDLEKVSPFNMDSAKFVLDDVCFSDYASILVPRAVSYNAGLLDYFFRGKLDVSAPDRCLYGLIDGSIVPQQFTKIKAKVGNVTYINDEQGNDKFVETIQSGTLQAVARYKKRTNYQPDLSNDPPTNYSIQPNFSYSVSQAIDLAQEDLDALNVSYKDFTFNFESSPIPTGITDLYLYIVFKGTLGNEMNNAIAVGFKDLSEPTHLTSFNTTDYLYQSGQLRPSTDDERVTINEKIAFCPSQFPVQDENEYQVEYTSMYPGEFGRLIYLSDPDIQNFYDVKDTPIDKPNVSVREDWYDILTSINQDGAASEVDEFRGKAFHDGISYVYYSDNIYNLWLAPWSNVTGDAIMAKSPLNW